MNVRQSLVALAVVLASWSFPAVSAAEPIRHFELSEDGNFLVFNNNRVLTAEHLSVLAAREDKGWHLGWFKSKGVTAELLPLGSVSAIPSTVEDLAAIAGSAALGGVNTLALRETATIQDVGISQAVPVPEPATLLLLGGGVLAVARQRVRDRRRAREKSRAATEADPFTN